MRTRPADPTLEKAFEDDWNEREAFIRNSPLTYFVELHDKAQTPDTHVVTGLADCRITLGDIRALLERLK